MQPSWAQGSGDWSLAGTREVVTHKWQGGGLLLGARVMVGGALALG